MLDNREKSCALEAARIEVEKQEVIKKEALARKEEENKQLLAQKEAEQRDALDRQKKIIKDNVMRLIQDGGEFSTDDIAICIENSK